MFPNELLQKLLRAIPGKGVDVNVQDQITEIIDLHLGQLIQTLLIATNTSIDDTTVKVTTVAEPTNGSSVCFKEGSAFYQGEILSHSASGDDWNIVLDTPLDFAYTTDGGCSERNINLATVDGSSTPVIFSVSPEGLAPGTKWDIVRVMFQIVDATEMDDGKFGGIANGLAKGIVMRHTDGIVKNIFNVKTNGDFAAHCFDAAYIPAAQGPSGNYAIRVRRTFGGQSKNGVVVRLSEDGQARSDTFEIIVQDDLTDLIDFQIIVQGHVVDD